MTGPLDFEKLVGLYYAGLHRFALSLTCNENDACDLTQETFLIWAAKGHQLQDTSKVKSWLFTTLHREFLEKQRKRKRFPELDLEAVTPELPVIDPELVQRLDSQAVVELLRQVDPIFRSPVALFYLDDYSYNDIARILEIPLGTVKSRIARGIGQIQIILARRDSPTDRRKGGV